MGFILEGNVFGKAFRILGLEEVKVSHVFCLFLWCSVLNSVIWFERSLHSA